jgi:Arc/MetJ-type ribon-helix-helix transcriptional regulator
MAITKNRLSVTVDSSLVEKLDDQVGTRRRYPTRSAAVENALRSWFLRQKDREVEEYYAEQSEQERAEDREWARFAGQALFEKLEQEEVSEPRRTRRTLKRRRR